jgi:hypothetical protein
MGFTKTVHPPAGATALLCSTEASITALGWFFLPMIILGTALLLAVALLLNNIQRQFPAYWWTPADLGRPKAEEKKDVEKVPGGAVKSRSSCAEVERISIDRSKITLPDWMGLEDEEKEMLEVLQTRLRNRSN